ncbi:MAG: sigma-70 family RNA polymerase sigma factor [Acidobacteriota bacterium]|nr:sigma-70 family RNA polymerase sigma factor [Acidobacteriota bacterium]
MKKRVLIVDDEEAIVTGLTMLFELEPFESVGALDRSAAEEIMGSSFCPVVIADLCLHSIEEGLALIDHIRVSSPGSRVLVLTAYATPAVVQDLLERGVEHVFQKPTPGAEILEAVLDLLAEIEREAAADDLTLEELYLSARSRLLSIPRRRFNLSPDSAEDVLQEAWLMFLEKRGIVRAPGPWLAGTVVNLARQHLDRRKRKRETPEEESGLAEMHGTSRGEVENMSVRQALGRIDERSRTLCELIGLDGFSYGEVSGAIGLPIGSIGPLYIRAKQKLREALSH